MDKNITKKLTAKNEDKRKFEKVLKILLLVALLVLGVVYFLLKVTYETGPFTVMLSDELSRSKGLIMYEKLSEKIERKILKTETLEYLDNISVNWLPQNLDGVEGGSHNGENYIAYTFYLENQGVDVIDYWYSTIIDDVIKDVDEAIRVRIYLNGKDTTYAKQNKITGQGEQGATVFYSEEYVEIEQREGMQPGDIDKFTIVIWIEGDDPDCIDSLIGGEMKMHMEITSEQSKIDKIEKDEEEILKPEVNPYEEEILLPDVKPDEEEILLPEGIE